MAPPHMQRTTPFVVFLLGGMCIGFLTFQQTTAAIWGAPTHRLQSIAMYSSLALVLASFVCLAAPSHGRILATVCIFGIGTLYIPGAAALVPGATRDFSPLAGIVLAAYFSLLAFALFFPTRWRVSVPLFAGCMVASAAFAATTYQHRLKQGELHNPVIVCFEWSSTVESLKVQDDVDGSLTAENRQSLIQNGVVGELRWRGTYGSPTESQRVIVICQSRIPAPQQLHYPKQGTVFYIFDGKGWKTIPEGPEFYPAHATLNPDGGLEQVTTSGGTQRVVPFRW